MEYRHELENLRRSLAMLNPGVAALSKERAEDLVHRLQELEAVLRQIRQLLDELEQ